MEMQTYFRAHNDYFWQWEEGGEVIAFPGGSTICYREQLLTILTAMVHDGVPKLGPLLLVLAAMNAQPEHVHKYVNALLEDQPDEPQKRSNLKQNVLNLLQAVASLPKQYTEGMRKVETLRALFRGCHNSVNAKTANSILNEFRQMRFGKEFYSAKENLPKGFVYHEFLILNHIGISISTVDDIKRRISGLPATAEQKVELDSEETEEPGPLDFIEELTENPQTFPIGSLVRRIWSGLNIPFHNILPSEQPIGGISDITNKGDFHRLLTTEFAYDDITFLSRLANHEALYINREVPPQSNKKERIILIDVSIRNWGTPKTIAYALLIAIARHPKTDIPCSAYAVGETYKEISFGNVDEIITSMQELSGCLHPGKGVRKFLDDFQRKRNMELIFVSNHDAMKVPALAVAVQDYQPLFRFWLLANQDGEVDVYKNQKNSRKHHQHFKLPLEQLWKPRKKTNLKNKNNQRSHNGPTALKYPILFPGCNVQESRLLITDGSAVFAVGNDRNVYSVEMPGDLSRSATKGWCRIYDSLKFAFAKSAIGYNSKGEIVILTHSPEQKLAVIANVVTGHIEEFEFAPDYWKLYPDFFWHDGHFNLLTRKVTHRLSPEQDGEHFIVESTSHPDPLVVQAYNNSKIRATEVGKCYPYFGTFLKNVNRVGISNGRLVLNKHELNVSTAGKFQWQTTVGSKAPQVMAKQFGSTFRFNDTHCVQITRSGIIMLVSGEEDETIYVPTMLDNYMGLATQRRFSGEEFYRSINVQQEIVPPQTFYDSVVLHFINGCISDGTKN